MNQKRGLPMRREEFTDLNSFCPGHVATHNSTPAPNGLRQHTGGCRTRRESQERGTQLMFAGNLIRDTNRDSSQARSTTENEPAHRAGVAQVLNLPSVWLRCGPMVRLLRSIFRTPSQ